MKRIIAMLLALCLCLGLCACGGNNENSTSKSENSTKETTEHIPTQAELETMYQQAKDFESNARFDEAINLYRAVFKYGFSDPDYSSKTSEEVLEIKEGNYILQKISCEYFGYAIWLFNDEIVERLKDPDSLKIYSLTIESDKSNPNRFYVVFDYGAANSFGGMVRDTFSAPYTLKDDEAKEIYESNKEFIDSNGCTATEYLIGNYYWCTIYYDTQKEAIINGTATY